LKQQEVRGSTVLAEATFARRDEAAEALRQLRESLSEPAFMKVLVRLVSGKEQGEKGKTAGRSQFGASATNGKGH
jgi:hypothetical protein